MNNNACILNDYPYGGDSCKITSKILDVSNLKTKSSKDSLCSDSVIDKELYAKLYGESKITRFDKRIKYAQCCPTNYKSAPADPDNIHNGKNVMVHRDYNNNIDKIRVSKASKQNDTNCVDSQNNIGDGWESQCNDFDKYYQCKTVGIDGISGDGYYEFDNLHNVGDCPTPCKEPTFDYDTQCCDSSLKDQKPILDRWVIYNADMTQAFVSTKNNEIFARKTYKFGISDNAPRAMTKHDECLLASAGNTRGWSPYYVSKYTFISKKPICSCSLELKNKKITKTPGGKQQISYYENNTKAQLCRYNKNWCDKHKPALGTPYTPLTQYDKCIINSGDMTTDHGSSARYGNFTKIYEPFNGGATIEPFSTREYNYTPPTSTHDYADILITSNYQYGTDEINFAQQRLAIESSTYSYNRDISRITNSSSSAKKQISESRINVDLDNITYNNHSDYTISTYNNTTKTRDDIDDAIALVQSSALIDSYSSVIDSTNNQLEKCVSQVKDDRKIISRANTEIDSGKTKNVLLYNKEINDLNSELSKTTNKIQTIRKNHSVKDQLSIYLIILLTIITVAYMIFKISYTYTHGKIQMPNIIRNISPSLKKYD
jgi:hypothetical protein